VQDKVKFQELEDVEPSVHDIKHLPSEIWTSFEAHMMDIDNVNFILIYITLQNLHSTEDYKATIRLFICYCSPITTSNGNGQPLRSAPEVFETAIKNLYKCVPGCSTDNSPFTSQKAYPMLPPIILEISDQCPTAEDKHLPRPRKMHFLSFVDMNFVDRNSTWNFGKCHLHKMPSAEVLSGNLKGFYLDLRRDPKRFGSGSAHLDQPMCSNCAVSDKAASWR
jgi:hypothetical protein